MSTIQVIQQGLLESLPTVVLVRLRPASGELGLADERPKNKVSYPRQSEVSLVHFIVPGIIEGRQL